MVESIMDVRIAENSSHHMILLFIIIYYFIDLPNIYIKFSSFQESILLEQILNKKKVNIQYYRKNPQRREIRWNEH